MQRIIYDAMDLQQFRIAHSTLMEHYQFIERELEGIYAALSGKSLYIGLKDVETFSINKVIRMVQEQEKSMIWKSSQMQNMRN